jgi:endoglucanase
MKVRIPIAVPVLLLVASAGCSSAPNSQDSTSEPDSAVELKIQNPTESSLHRGEWPVVPWHDPFPWQGSHGGHPKADAGKPSTTDHDAGSDEDASTDRDAATGHDADLGHDAATGHDAAAGHDAGSSSHGSDAGTSSSPPSSGLHVVGNQIIGTSGSAITLHGVNRSGSEFACVGGYGFFDGPTDQASITAIKSWGVNAVRVPLNEDCWLGINGVVSTYAGANYQQAITTYVDLLLANGVYPILDLHWNAPGTELATGQEPMADSDHAPAFWTSVADAFKSEGSVIFELYNEPWPGNNEDTTAAWTCWRDGGTCASISYPVAGMQTLVTAVRATGAANLVLLGGIEYSNALSQWMTFKPTDPLNNLAAAWHVYEGNLCSTASCFNDIAAPVAAAFPIVATEIGDSSCDGAFLTTVMEWLDSKGQSYSPWTWNTWGTSCGEYSLITDYTGTPNGAYGTAYQSHLQGL